MTSNKSPPAPTHTLCSSNMGFGGPLMHLTGAHLCPWVPSQPIQLLHVLQGSGPGSHLCPESLQLLRRQVCGRGHKAIIPLKLYALRTVSSLCSSPSLTLCLPSPINNDRMNGLLKTMRRPAINYPSLPQKTLHCSESLVRPENYLQ